MATRTLNKKLIRDTDNAMLFGVCAGLGEYFNVDTTIIRLLWIVLTAFTGFIPGMVAYVVAAIVIPQK
jgi:phage shock protein C